MTYDSPNYSQLLQPEVLVVNLQRMKYVIDLIKKKKKTDRAVYSTWRHIVSWLGFLCGLFNDAVSAEDITA